MENNDKSSEDISPFKLIADHFQKKDLRTLSLDWEKKSLFFQMYEKQVVMGCSFHVSEDDHRLQILLRYPFFIADPKMRPSVGELVARINFGLKVGTFEFDFKDGELRFHITHLMESLSISEKLLLRLFNTGMSTTDRYFSAFMQHVYSGVTPEDAVYMAELDFHAEAIEEPPALANLPPVEEKKQLRKRSPKKKPLAETPDVQPQLLDEASGKKPEIQNPPSASPEGNPGERGEDESQRAA